MNRHEQILERMRSANPVAGLDVIHQSDLESLNSLLDVRRSPLTDLPEQPLEEKPSQLPPARRQPRLAWVFAAAVVLVLVAIGVVGLFVGGGGSDESVVDEPEPPPDVQSLEWTMTEFDESLVGFDEILVGSQTPWPAGFTPIPATLTGVTAGGPGFVAVGGIDCEGTGAGCYGAAVWTSTDGTDWSRVYQDAPEVFSETSGLRKMADVTAGGPGLVAVGHGLSEPDRPGVYGVVWFSDDGHEWSRVPFDRAWLRSVTAGGPGFVAVGSARSVAAVWTSIDGINWDRVPHDPEVFGARESEITAVTVGGPGLVAVGAVGSNAAVWVSTDGFTWSRIPHDEKVFGGVHDQVINDVVAGGPGLVAVGTDLGGAHRAVVWTSPDGITWTRVPHDLIFGGGGMRSIVTYGNGLVAVGTGVWTSIDGLTWTVARGIPGSDAPLEEAESWRVIDITTGRHGLVAVGSTGDSDHLRGGEETPQAVVWTAKPQD